MVVIGLVNDRTMTEEQVVNLNFVKLIEQYPCLYDTSLSSYTKQDVKDRSWQEIASKVNESVKTCKDRWKNLRTVFVRNHNRYDVTATGLAKRKYYLADAMSFLLPFIKKSVKTEETSATLSDCDSIVVSDMDDDNSSVDGLSDYDYDYDEHSEDQQQSGSGEVSSYFKAPIISNFQRILNHNINIECNTSNNLLISNCNNTGKRINNHTKFSMDYFQEKIQQNKTECADQKFLLSLLPDVEEMDLKQKRLFKRKILDIIYNILDKNEDEDDDDDDSDGESRPEEWKVKKKKL